MDSALFVSELIAKLEMFRDTHGDVRVGVWNCCSSDHVPIIGVDLEYRWTDTKKEKPLCELKTGKDV